MAVNLYKKSKNENDEEERRQVLAQIQQDSLNRKNADIQAVKKVQNSLGYRYNAFVNNTAHNLVNLQRTATPIVQSTWNNIQNQANNFLNRTKTYFSNTKKSPEPMQAQNTSTWNKVQSVSQNAPIVQPSANMTVPTTKGMEEKRNEQVKQQQEKSKDFKETIRQNSHIATQEEIANTQVTSPEAYLKAQEYAKKAEKGDYSFLFEKAGDEIISGGQNALGGIVQGFAGLGQMATRALGADNATNALMNFSDEMLTKQNRAGETRQLLKQNLERAGKGGFLNDVLNVGGNLVESVSNTVISGAFGGGSGSTFGMGISAGGNAFAKRQKESNGQNYARNVVASSLEGVWNSVWEKATGGNLLTRKTSINDAGEVIAENTGWLDKFALKKIAKYAKNPRTINAVNKVWQQLGEVVEEVGTDLFSAITNDIVAKENFKENFNWAQEKETAFYTVLSTLVLSKLGLGGMEAQDLANQYGLSLEQVQQVEKEVDSFVEDHNVKTDEKTVGKIIDGLMDKNGLDTKTLDIDNTLQEIYNENIQGKATPSPESEEYKTNIQSIINNIPIPDDVKAQIQPFLNSNATMNEDQYNSLKDTLKKYVETDTQRQYDELKNNVSAQYDQIDAQISELDNIKPENFQDAESRKYYAQQMGKEFDTSTFEQLLATYPENRNGKRTVKAYKEIAKAYGQQMALNGLSFDEVRANTVGAWQQYEPNKNITSYDNKEHKNQGFDRLNSQVWSQEVYDSYKETMTNQLNQQKQNIMNDYQTQFQEIEDNSKAIEMTIDNLKPQVQESQLSPEEVQRQKDLVEQFAKNRGVNVRYDAEAFNGSNEEAKIVDLGNGKREMVINPNADPDAILVKLATHEMFHDTIRTKPHDKLTQLVMDKLKQDNRYQEWRNSVSEAYQEQLQGLNEQQQNALLDEEMTAKYLGEYLGDEQFVQDLVNSTERSTVQRIMDWIDNRLQQLKNIVTGNKEAEYWRKVKENFEKAYNSKYQGQEGSYYSFGGVNAQTHNGDTLNKAIDMEKEGKSKEEIFKETGWFRGNEGRWRFEISNEKAQISDKLKGKNLRAYKEMRKSFDDIVKEYERVKTQNKPEDKYFIMASNEIQENAKKNMENFANTEIDLNKIESIQNEDVKKLFKYENIYLPEILLNNDELFKAYPFLNNIQIKLPFNDNMFGSKEYNITKGTLGFVEREGYDDIPKAIYITKEGIENRYDLKKLILHEVQHAIQAYEGFSGGADINRWKSKVDTDITKKLSNIRENIKKEFRDKEGRLDADYYKVDKAIENYIDSRIKLENYNLAFINDDAEHAKTTNFLQREGFDSGRQLMDHYEMLKYQSEKTLNSLKTKNVVNKLEKIWEDIRGGNKKAYRLYKNTAGEIEAREVEKRANYTDEERRKLPFINNKNTVYSENMYKDYKQPKMYQKQTSFDEALKQDNQGRELSKQQQEYFKDSKLRDNRGELLTMYHSTSANFTVFDKSKLGDNTGYNNTAYGFFVTNNQKFSERFKDIDNEGKQGKTMEFYVEAKKPIVHPYNAQYKYNDTELEQITREWLKATGSEDMIDALEQYVEDDEANSIWEAFVDIYNTESTFESSEAEKNNLEKNGYDAIEIVEGLEKDLVENSNSNNVISSYAVFNSNQIKNVDNTNPTNNPDIRYSKKTKFDEALKQDNQGNKINPGMQEYLKDISPEELVDGKVPLVYHTMTDTGKQFNEFNPVGTPNYRFDDQIVNYYTDNLEMSGSYANGDYLDADTTRYTSIEQIEKRLKNINLIEGTNFKLEKRNGIYGIYNQIEADIYNKAKEFYNGLDEEEKDFIRKLDTTSFSETLYKDEYGLNDSQKETFYKTLNKYQKWLNDMRKEFPNDSHYNGIQNFKPFQSYLSQGLREFNVFSGDGTSPRFVYENENDLFRNAIADISGNNNYQYSGYVKLTNPYVVDAGGSDWKHVEFNVPEEYQRVADKITDLSQEKLMEKLNTATQKAIEREQQITDQYDDYVNAYNKFMQNSGFHTQDLMRGLNEIYSDWIVDLSRGDIKNLDTLDLDTKKATQVILAINPGDANRSSIDLQVYNDKYRQELLDLTNKKINFEIGTNTKEMRLFDFLTSMYDIQNKRRELLRKPNTYFEKSFKEDLLKGYSDDLVEDFTVALKDAYASLKTQEEYGLKFNSESIKEDIISSLKQYKADTVSTKTALGWFSTNDVVKKVIDLNKNGANYDGLIMKNVVDYGGVVGKRTPGNLYVTFDSNQFKAQDNPNPTEDPDIRYNIKSKAYDDYLKANNPNRSGVTIGDLQQRLPVKQPETTQPKLPTQQSNIANDYIKFRELTEQVKNGDITEAEFDRLSNLDDIQQELKDLGRTDEQVKNTIAELANLRDNQLNEQDINNLINLMGMNAYDREVTRNRIARGEPILPTTNVQPTGENKEANLPISQETTSVPLNNQKQRRAYKSIIESEMMSDEAKAIAKKFIGQDTYTPDSNAKQLSRADDRIQRNGVEKELNTLETNAMEGKTIKADDIAVGDRLIQYYSKVGDSENLQRAIRATAMAGTQAGRSVQAFALLRHQTPEGMAIWIQNSVDKLNSKTKNGQFDFTQEMQEKILNSTEENLQENVDEVMKELGQQVPKDTLSKLDVWRYFSMLANPKTHIRNIVGNFAMGLTQRVSNKVAGTIEQVTGRDRTKTSIFERRSKENIEFAKNDLKNVSSQLGIGTSKYSNPQNAIQQNQRTFKSDALEKSLGRMFNLNDNLLEAEDNFGLKNAYVRNLSDYMSANKLNPNTITNEQLQKARAIAIDKALEATFHQASNLASVLNQLENKNIGTRLILGGLVPFKKTPINVAKAGAEYSPAGLAKSLVYDTVQLRKGNINTNQWIDNISKGLTGTGIAVLGYALAKAGILKAGGDDDKEDKYKQAMGDQPYAVTINGKSYSLDWLAPSGIPLFVGAELARLVDDKTEKDGETENEVLKAMGRVADATSSLLNPMSEMSMISGITSALQSYSNDPGQAVMNIPINTLKSYVGQFVPTALGQVARTADKYERDTSSTESGLLPKAIDSAKNQIMNKIPGLRQMLPTKKDIWGEEVETQDYFHNAVLPYTEKEIKSNPVDTELNSLYEKTGENIYPNTSLAKTVTYEGSKTRLTNQDYNEFKESYGKNSYRILNNLINSNEYKSLSDEQKVKAIQDVYTYANNLNKYNYAQKKGITFETPSDVEKVNAIKANGGSETDYFKYKGITDGLTKDSEKISAIQNSKLSNKSKRAVYNATVGKDDTFYQSTNIDVNEYLKYKTANIEGTKDENGKTISGTKKQAQLDYINDNISGYENRLLLMGKDYKLSRSQQQDLASYIDTLPNADELFELLSKNFTVKDGTVYYK